MANLDDFKAALKGGGARPNLFRAIVNFPPGTAGDARLASFMIKGASLPESTLGQIEVPFRGRRLKVGGDRTFNTWTITVMNDTDFAIRDAFERWSNLVNSHADNDSAFGGSAALDYMFDMQVDQLDRDENVLKTYTFRGAWPANVSQIDLNYESNDQIEEFTVELAYQYWESNTTS